MTRAAALFAGIFCLALLQSVVLGALAADEAWFLQVATRVSDGDVLYRDVYFNTTPLAPALAAALVAVLGSHVLVVKALAAAVIAFEATMIAAAARELGARWAVAAPLGAAAVLIPGTGVGSVYSELSVALAAAALVCLLAWRRRRDPRLAAAAGAAAGLSFAAKHSTGAIAVVAVLALLVSWERRAARTALLAATATVATALAAVAAVGGAPKLLEYGVTAKGAYVDAGQASYLGQLGELARDAWAAVRSPTDYERLSAAVGQGQFALPLLAAAALALAYARAPRDRRPAVLAVGAFVAAAAVNVYPIADLAHVGYATPLVLLAIWLGARALLSPRVVTGAALVLVLVPLVVAVRGATVLAGDAYVSLDVPHFEHIEARPGDAAAYLRTARGIADAAGAGPLFVLDNGAAFYYLVAGVRNPTPFDIPVVTALGRDGEQEIARAFATGRIQTVCMGLDHVRPSRRPRRLAAAVRRLGRRGADVGRCTLYHAR